MNVKRINETGVIMELKKPTKQDKTHAALFLTTCFDPDRL